MMTERDRLIDICNTMTEFCRLQACDYCKYEYLQPLCVSEAIADVMIANGVIVPPVKVGDTVYHLFQKQGIVPRRIRRFQLNSKGLWLVDKNGAFSIDAIGKTVFLTREEAEKALKERKENA